MLGEEKKKKRWAAMRDLMTHMSVYYDDYFWRTSIHTTTANWRQ